MGKGPSTSSGDVVLLTLTLNQKQKKQIGKGKGAIQRRYCDADLDLTTLASDRGQGGKGCAVQCASTSAKFATNSKFVNNLRVKIMKLTRHLCIISGRCFLDISVFPFIQFFGPG